MRSRVKLYSICIFISTIPVLYVLCEKNSSIRSDFETGTSKDSEWGADMDLEIFEKQTTPFEQTNALLKQCMETIKELETATSKQIEFLRKDFNEKIELNRMAKDASEDRLRLIIERLEATVAGLVADSQDRTSDWLKSINLQARKNYNVVATAVWLFNTNITDHHAKLKNKELLNMKQFLQRAKDEATRRMRPYFDEDTKRQLKLYQLESAVPHNNSQLKRLVEVRDELSRIFVAGKVCVHNVTKCWSLDPELNNVMATSNDLDELKSVWKSWHDVTGPVSRNLYSELVDLSNIGARDNGFQNIGEFWRSMHFEIAGIDKIAENLYQELKPLYQQLFTYVRRQLLENYGAESGIDPEGPIPAHLLGNMWAQGWSNLLNKRIAIPYPDVATSDVTEELVKQNFTVNDMFRLAERFFTSIGLYPMTDEFWNRSMLVKPIKRNVSCHGTAYDFHQENDFRIKMCTEITHESLFVVHHEMGHIQYYMAYRHQPDIYRTGANTAFHEAIGDLIALSVNTVTHLKTIGLLDDSTVTPERRYSLDYRTIKQDINFLMKQALRIVGFLPFGYLVDKWRWSVFDGTITPDDYNRKWWQMRLEYQGLVPPVMRSEHDLDPAAKYHVTLHVPYIRYFIAHVIQFQFYEAMCRNVHSGPLHQCDFYGSKSAGAKLKRMLRMGKSRPWPDAMEVLTGQREISSKPLLKYFKPLANWLIKQNFGETVGWLKSGQTIESTVDTYFKKN